MSEIRVNNITNRSETAGPSIAGIPVVNSDSYFVVPTGRTGQRYADDGENIVRDGLVLYLDAKYSYPSKTGIGTTTSGAAAPAGSSTDVDVYTWYDMSGNENHGELRNGVGYNAANGGSLVFDGVNDFVDINDTEFRFSNTFSLSVWFYWDGVNKFANLLGKRLPVSGFSQYSFGFYDSPYVGNPSNILNFFARPDVGKLGLTNNLDDVLLSYTLPSSGWYNAVCSISPFNQYLYVNSVLRSSTTKDLSTYTYQISSYNFQVGIIVGSTGYFNNKIPQVLVYKNKALTASEVLQNYNATKSRYGL